MVAFVNQKGGVGKTTSAVTLAHLWAREARQVLLLDLDAQGNVADCLGLQKTGNLHRFLIDEVETAAILPSGREHLYTILGDKRTTKTKQILGGDPFGVFKLREALKGLRGYEVLVLDVAPGADILQLSALVACTHFVIPVSLEHLALVGVREALESVASLKKVQAFQGSFAGVLPTMLDRSIKVGHADLSEEHVEGCIAYDAGSLNQRARGTVKAAGRNVWTADIAADSHRRDGGQGPGTGTNVGGVQSSLPGHGRSGIER